MPTPQCRRIARPREPSLEHSPREQVADRERQLLAQERHQFRLIVAAGRLRSGSDGRLALALAGSFAGSSAEA